MTVKDGVTSEELYPLPERRADYEAVFEALLALSRAWTSDRPPTREEGLDVHVRASLSLARMAANLDVPAAAL